MGSHKPTTRRDALALIAAGALLTGRTIAASAQQPAPPGRAARDVDLHLALAVDASGSVNQPRFELQKRGYAEAFVNPRVLQAVQSGPQAAIAVAMYQWTGPALQVPVVPWTLIDSEASIKRLAGAIAASERHLYGGGTSISGAIDYGVQFFRASSYTGGRRVIDVSGDGSNNRGRSSVAARDEAVAAAININGLPILELEPHLEEFYRQDVIGGPGAFVVAAETFQDFGNAILRKLILEIAQPAGAPATTSGAA